MRCLYAKLAYNVDKSLFPSHAISLSFPKLMYRPFFYILYNDENCQTLPSLVQTILLSWVPIFPIYMKARFLGAPYHNLHSLSPALSLSLIHIWHSLKMDQRKVANIIIQFEALKVKAKKCSRERVLPPKRGSIKRRIFSCLIHKLMKITRGNVWFSRSIHQDLSLSLYIYLNDLNITVMSFLLTLVLVPTSHDCCIVITPFEDML